MTKRIILPLFFIFTLINLSFSQVQKSTPSFHYQEAERKNKFVRELIKSELSKTTSMESYDVKYYLLNLEIDPATELISGFVEMLAVVTSPISSFDLHLYDNMIVDSVFIKNEIVSFAHSNNRLSVTLPEIFDTNKKINTTIFYHGTPTTGAFGFDNHNGKPMIWTLSEPFGARSWWPCKDTPSDKADSVDIIVTVPKNLIVASNGTLRETINVETGKTRYWWHEKYPIVTYLISLAIYPYYVYYDDYISLTGETMKLHFYVFPDHVNQVMHNYGLTKDMISAFATLFGEYPFLEEKYGHAEFLWGGGMEHQTLTSLGGWSEGLIAHELAHQWWGDMVTCNSFHHIWLNEGFATYSESLWREWAYGKKAYFERQLRNFYFGPGTIFVEDPLNEPIFHGGLSYDKGSCVLHMLRHVVGDSNFFKILQTYYKNPNRKYGTATTEQFQQICESVSRMNLSSFFHQWIYEQGYPEYEFVYSTIQHSADQYEVSGTIKQIQTLGPIFEMPLDITITTANGDTNFVFWTKQASVDFSFFINQQPSQVQLDKDKWVLSKVHTINRYAFSLENFVLDDSPGNNNGHLEGGESANLIVNIKNNGLPVNQVTVVLSTTDLDITITDSSFSTGPINFDSIFNNTDSPFNFTVSPEIEGKFIAFKLQLFENGNIISTLNLYIPAGSPTVLLIDDDFGLNHEIYFEDLMQKSLTYYKLWNVKNQGTPDSLDRYKTIVLFTGLARYNILSVEMKMNFIQYLEHGGKLLISSQNLAYDLTNNGNESDVLFLSDKLGVIYLNDISKDVTASGVINDPISNGQVISFDGNFGQKNQISRDVIAPVLPAVSILNYLPSGNSAGIRLYDENTGSKVVFLPFGLEGVAGPFEDSAQQLLRSILNWFDSGESAVHLKRAKKLPIKYALFQNYPNPFNPYTTINFEIPETEIVNVTIFNLLGEKIANLMDEEKQPGSYTLKWDGKDSAGKQVVSGIYFYQLSSGNIKIQKKMIFIQ